MNEIPLALESEISLPTVEPEPSPLRDCLGVTQFSQTSIPVTITTPGQYCLNEDVTINNFTNNAFIINSDNVSLNLNGYRIIGTGGLNGIIINGRFNVTIANGTISNMRANGILVNPQAQLLVLDSITTFSNTVGISVLGVNKAIIKNCSASLTQGTGFAFSQGGPFVVQNCIIENCNSFNNVGQGFSFNNCFNIELTNCTANNNQNSGFNQTNGDKVFYTNCIANSNILHGFISIASNGIFNNCQGFSNRLSGFLIRGNKYTLTNCEASSNGSGFTMNTLNSFVQNCVSLSNLTNGFIFQTDSAQNQVRNNTATGNDVGFQDDGTGNKFYSNFASNNTTNYVNITNVSISPTILTPINFTANIAE